MTAVTNSPLDYIVQESQKNIQQTVRNSLAAGHAQLAYQPIVTADHNNFVAFYEGLIRLRDEGGRIIPAGQFMSDVEETAMGRDIDCASLRLGLNVLRAHPKLRLSINMSARSLADGKWRRTLMEGLRGQTKCGERLILEISETSAMQLHEVLIRFMEEMQPYGVNFALDDFGAGLIAFQRLKDFYFDMVKIDRCFVRNIHDSPDNQVMTEALVNVAHQFEMFAIAEGVESQQEAAVLTALGVDCLQGYLYGVPKLKLTL